MVFTMFLVYFALDKSSLDFEVIFKFCTLEGEDVWDYMCIYEDIFCW